MSRVISFYSKQSDFEELSNFYEIPEGFIYKGKKFRTSEHAFQAQKYDIDDGNKSVHYTAYFDHIRKARNPFAAKLLANQKKNKKYRDLDLTIETYKELGIERRSDWAKVKLSIMKEILSCKFTQSECCKAILLSTGEAHIVEDNPHDDFWGLGQGEGRNEMGKLLMNIRESLL